MLRHYAATLRLMLRFIDAAAILRYDTYDIR